MAREFVAAACERVTVFSVKHLLRFPWGVGFEDAVGQDDELSRDGDDGDFSGFSGVEETAVEGLECGIASDSGDRCHVEGGAHARSAAANVIAALGRAAALGMGRKAGQDGGLMEVEAS